MSYLLGFGNFSLNDVSTALSETQSQFAADTDRIFSSLATIQNQVSNGRLTVNRAIISGNMQAGSVSSGGAITSVDTISSEADVTAASGAHSLTATSNLIQSFFDLDESNTIQCATTFHADSSLRISGSLIIDSVGPSVVSNNLAVGGDLLVHGTNSLGNLFVEGTTTPIEGKLTLYGECSFQNLCYFFNPIMLSNGKLLPAALTDVETDITSLTSTVSTLSTDLTNLTTNVTALGSAVVSLSSQSATHNTDISNLQSSVATLTASVNTLESTRVFTNVFSEVFTFDTNLTNSPELKFGSESSITLPLGNYWVVLTLVKSTSEITASNVSVYLDFSGKTVYFQPYECTTIWTPTTPFPPVLYSQDFSTDYAYANINILNMSTGASTPTVTASFSFVRID